VIIEVYALSERITCGRLCSTRSHDVHMTMTELRLAAQLAQMTSDGELDRLLPSTASFSPRSLALEADSELGPVLVWDWTDEEEPREWRHARGVLTDFARLGSADDSEIMTYARRYGPLFLCEHDRPASHNPRGWMTEDFRRLGGLEGSKAALFYARALELMASETGRDVDELKRAVNAECVPLRREPLSIWRSYARRVRAILAISAGLHGVRGTPRAGSREHWADVAPEDRYQRALLPIVGSEPTIEDEREVVAYWIRQLLEESGVRLDFYWPRGEEPQVQLDGVGCLGLVGQRLAFAVARRPGFLCCPYCGEFFTPDHGNRTVCDQCRTEKRPEREAAKRYRAKKRSGCP
jgi:hypothetical protein